jgi:phenylalanine-4-hydroxylase
MFERSHAGTRAMADVPPQSCNPKGTDADELTRSDEENEVWSLLLERVRDAARMPDWHHPTYLASLAWLAKFESHMPTRSEINDWLQPTGWSAAYVAGYVPVLEYRALLAARTFPVARAIRRMRDIDHSAAPDFAHDLLGHLPLLFDEGYRELLQQWASRALDAAPSEADRRVSAALGALIEAKCGPEPDPREILNHSSELRIAHRQAVDEQSRCFQFENFFTWTIEFGILSWTASTRWLIGAAALSSPGEIQRIFSGQTRIVPFGPHIVARPVDYTRYQDEIFIARSFEQCDSILRTI